MEAAPAGEVRTFLIADVRGYTRFCQARGDEAGARLASRFAALAREGTAAHDGEVIELRGDEALAVFRSPRQALRAAAALQETFRHVAATDQSLPLRVGIGLDAGEAIPVEGGYRGGALNLAARLCSLAGPGEVLASEGVIHLARKMDGLEYVERGFAPLKGFAAPVRIIEVQRENGTSPDAPILSHQADTPKEPRLPIGGFLGALPSTPIVARETEMTAIRGMLDAVAGGSGQLVMLAGEPGVGKTRLAQEVTLEARNRGFLLTAGRCYEAHRTLPFYPFLDALATLYAAAPAPIRAEAGRRWAPLRLLLPELLGAGDAGTGTAAGAQPTLDREGSQEERQRLYRAVTGFIQTLAAATPVALFLDDLHWADEASIDLLQHLARHTRADAVLVLGTYRDVELGRHHPLEAALRDLMREDLVERIAVRRLAREGTAALMAVSFGEEHITEEFATLVHGRTEGNPFFVQHVLRVLVERGDVFRRDGKWDRRGVDEIEVPESVRSVIGQRLSQLSETTQDLLREASVLGQGFSFDDLQAMSGRQEAEIERALEEGESRGLVREAGQDAYVFDHALTQQALYAELTGRRRRRLHLAAAEAIDALPPRQRDRRAGELAWHFLEAGAEERALPCTLMAAQQAESSFANGDAERQYTTALEIAQGMEDREQVAAILARRGALRLVVFDGDGAAADYERLLTMSRQSFEQPGELAAMLGLARARYITALSDTTPASAESCRDLYEEAYELAGKLADRRSMVRALLGTRWLVDFFPEYFERSLANRREALAISRELGDEELILDSEMTLWRAERRPELGDEIEHKLRRRGALYKLNEHYFSMMWAHLAWGNFQRGIECCDAGTRLAQELDVPPVQYSTLKALCQIGLGRYNEALRSLDQELAVMDHPFGRALHAGGLSTYLLDVLDYDGAAREARNLIDYGMEVQRAWMKEWAYELLVPAILRGGEADGKTPAVIAEDLRALGDSVSPLARAEIALRDGSLETALDLAEHASADVERRRAYPDYVDAQLLRSRILLRMGNAGDALEAADDALGHSRRMDALPRVWRAEMARAEYRVVQGDAAAAAEARAGAEDVIRGLAASIPEAEVRQTFLARALVNGREAGDG